MKAILFENGMERDIPKKLIKWLERNEIEWEFKSVYQQFYPENRANFSEWFGSHPTGQTFITNTVFVDFIELEMFVLLLDKYSDKNYTFYIQNSALCDNLVKYLNMYESDITPDTEEMDNNPKLREAFKQVMNGKLEKALSNHNIKWIDYGEDVIDLNSFDDIQNGVYDDTNYLK